MTNKPNPENEKKSPPTPRDKKNKEQEKKPDYMRTVVMWMAVTFIALMLANVWGAGGAPAPEISYTEFKAQLASENVTEVTITAGQKVEGKLRNSTVLEGDTARSFQTLLPIQHSEDILASLEEQGVVIHAEEADFNFWSIFWSIIPWIAIIAIWIFIMRRASAGPGSQFTSFGQSKARTLDASSPEVTFDDVAGADEAKHELQEVVEFLQNPQRFARLGGRLPKGVLLVGPPGTGKTLLARAVAGQAKVPFFTMSGSEFVEMIVGVGASRVRDLFEKSKQHAPCIIFIDEIDAVGRQRGAGLGGGHDEREQTLNQLLVEMDGFSPNQGIILLAATNRPDVLDPALLRPGRFDRQVVVDAPDLKGREKILEVHVRRTPLAPDVDLKALAKKTPGMSGADLANVVNEAALLAARGDGEVLIQEHFEKAIDKVMLGTERTSMILSEEERKLTAYHEAGHTVVALKTDVLDPIHKVSIVPRGRALGITASLPEEDRHSYPKDWLEARLVMLLGGRVAEEMTFGMSKITTGAGDDIRRATDLARRMVSELGMSEKIGLMSVGSQDQELFLGRDIQQQRSISPKLAEEVDSEVRRIISESHESARALLRENHDMLELIAQALLERETLDSKDIKYLVKHWTLPPAEDDEEKVEEKEGLE